MDFSLWKLFVEGFSGETLTIFLKKYLKLGIISNQNNLKLKATN